MSDGFVYCLANASHKGILKIGQTSKTPAERAKSLRTAGVPTPFEVVSFVHLTRFREAEKAIHRRLAEVRVPDGRECFRLKKLEADRYLTAVAFAEELSIPYEQAFDIIEKRHRMPLSTERSSPSSEKGAESKAYAVVPYTPPPVEWESVSFESLQYLCLSLDLPADGTEDQLRAVLIAERTSRSTQVQLKEECRAAGLKVSGNKTVLASRLLAAESSALG